MGICTQTADQSKQVETAAPARTARARCGGKSERQQSQQACAASPGARSDALSGILARSVAARRPPPANAVLQRLVYRMGSDPVSLLTEKHLVDLDGGIDTTRSLRLPSDPTVAAPLAELRENETLHVIGHGDGAGRIEGLSAYEFVPHLLSKGLDPKKHRGTIRLLSCFSATTFASNRMLSEEILLELRRWGFASGLISFDGLVRVQPAARVGTVAPENIAKYDRLVRVLDVIARQLNAINTRRLQEIESFLESVHSFDTAADEEREPSEHDISDDEQLERELAALVSGAERTRPARTATQRPPSTLEAARQEQERQLMSRAAQTTASINELFVGQQLGVNLRYVPRLESD